MKGLLNGRVSIIKSVGFISLALLISSFANDAYPAAPSSTPPLSPAHSTPSSPLSPTPPTASPHDLFTFNSGTIASSDQVNHNFEQLKYLLDGPLTFGIGTKPPISGPILFDVHSLGDAGVRISSNPNAANAEKKDAYLFLTDNPSEDGTTPNLLTNGLKITFKTSNGRSVIENLGFPTDQDTNQIVFKVNATNLAGLNLGDLNNKPTMENRLTMSKEGVGVSHIKGLGGTPKLDDCKPMIGVTGSTTIKGSDAAGAVTFQPAGTASCTITFDSEYSNKPFCVATSDKETREKAVTATASKKNIVIHSTEPFSDETVSYICFGN